MSWYRTGTITATNGSKVVTGSGTVWTNILNGVTAGRMLLLPAAGTVQVYEIASVQSDTQLTLADNFTGATGAGKAYAIPTSPNVSIETLALEISATLKYYQQQLAGWQQLITGTGMVTLTSPDGQTVSVRSQQAWDTELNKKVTGTLQSSYSDSTAGAVAKLSNSGQGIFGLGNTVGAPVTQASGFFSYRMPADALTDIGLSAVGVGYQSVYLPNRRAQIYQSYADGQLRHRMSHTESAVDADTTWRVCWDDVNLVKQTSLFDATANSLMLNGAWGWGGTGELKNLNDDGFLTWARSAATGSRVFRNNVSSTYTRRYAAGILIRGGDSYAAISFGTNPTDGSEAHGVQVNAGNEAGTGNITYNLATKNIAETISSIKTFTENPRMSRGSFPGIVLENTGIALGTVGREVSTLLESASTLRLYIRNGQNTTGQRLIAIPLTGSGTALILGVNASADANGFIKSASPIMRLANSENEMPDIWLDGFVVSGCGAVNEEATGAIAQRIDTGVYSVTGTLGLATEGWTIEIPQDVNGNRLCFVETKIAENGEITILVSKRKFDIETGNIVAGAPMDIPTGRWVDLRLSMKSRDEEVNLEQPDQNGEE